MGRRPGFTILELTLALIIGFVLIALVGPPISRTERRLSSYVAASLFRSDVVAARQRAVLSGETVRVVIDGETRSYRIEDGSGRSVVDRTLEEGLVISTTAHDQAVLFSPRGTSNLYSTTWISVRGDVEAHRYGLRVSPSGSIEAR